MENGGVRDERRVCFQAMCQREKIEATKKDDMDVSV